MKLFFVAFIIFSQSLSTFAASEFKVEESFPEKPPTELEKAALYQSALEGLVKSEMKLLNLNTEAYEAGVSKHFSHWQENVLKRQKQAGQPPIPVTMSQFVQLEGLFSQLIQTRFAQRSDKSDVWQLTLQGQAEPKLIELHFNRFTKTTPLEKKLYLDVNITPTNFSWVDLQLKDSTDFVRPLSKEWLKWFADGRLPEGVDEIVICDDLCHQALIKWEQQDETKMHQFISPELMGSWLLSIEMKLEREVSESLGASTKVAMSGGVSMTELDSKRRLHWVDLAGERYTLKSGVQKEMNSALATLCYRAPLGKFLEFKTIAGQSAMPRNSTVVRLENPAHMGQALRLLEWIKTKAKDMNAEGKLDSFNRKEARILIYFVGEGNKFKSLVSNVKELESEWGKPITVNDQGEGPVFGLPGAQATP